MTDEKRIEEQDLEANRPMADQMMRTMKYNGQVMSKLLDMVDTIQKQGRFKMVFLVLPVILLLFMMVKEHYDKESFYDPEKGYVAQVVITGEIKLGSKSAGADHVIPALRAAFADKKAKGVLLRISSPGGSPNQSILIHQEILKLKKQYPEKLFTVIGEESLTSGAYWIASASDEIHTLPATLVGSVGVIFTTFDLSALAERFDVKRQIITAGKNKSRIDMFVKPSDESIGKLRGIAEQLHEEFIEVVQTSRGDRLVGDPDDVFSGDFWLGTKALELGFVDSVTSTTDLLVETFGTDTVKNYSAGPSFLQSLGFNAQAQPILPELNYGLKVIEPAAMGM